MRTYVTAALIALGLLLVIGMVLPAVQYGREAANNLSCGNHFRLLGLALLKYHDIHGRFPTGTIPSDKLDPEERLSWYVSLLPLVDQDALSKSIDPANAWNAGSNRSAAEKQVLLFLCPGGPREDRSRIPGVTNYIGVAGVCSDAATVTMEDRRAGAFGYDRCSTAKDIKDGTSCTLLVIESSIQVGPWMAGGPATVRGLTPSLQPYLGPHRQYGGLHHHGHVANACFADGSRRSLQQWIQPQVFEALITINGGEKVNMSDF